MKTKLRYHLDYLFMPNEYGKHILQLLTPVNICYLSRIVITYISYRFQIICFNDLSINGIDEMMDLFFYYRGKIHIIIILLALIAYRYHYVIIILFAFFMQYL